MGLSGISLDQNSTQIWPKTNIWPHRDPMLIWGDARTCLPAAALGTTTSPQARATSAAKLLPVGSIRRLKKLGWQRHGFRDRFPCRTHLHPRRCSCLLDEATSPGSDADAEYLQHPYTARATWHDHYSLHVTKFTEMEDPPMSSKF